MNKLIARLLLFIYGILFQASLAHAWYLLCGGDEDGCSSSNYSVCFCIPFDGLLSSEPYCLNLDNVSCTPLSQIPNCPSSTIVKDQATCLAIAYQSEPTPSCTLVSHHFCTHNGAYICEKDGGIQDCHHLTHAQLSHFSARFN